MSLKLRNIPSGGWLSGHFNLSPKKDNAISQAEQAENPPNMSVSIYSLAEPRLAGFLADSFSPKKNISSGGEDEFKQRNKVRKEMKLVSVRYTIHV